MTGVYQCLAKACPKRGEDFEREWEPDWPLPKRQYKCPWCGHRMLLLRIEKPMTEEVKKRLRAVQAARREAV